MLFRNDDISSDTKLEELERFCDIFDKYGFKIIHGVTIFGPLIPMDSSWSNQNIDLICIEKFTDNKDVIEYLFSRNDEIAVHGYKHYHYLNIEQDMGYGVGIAKRTLEDIFQRPVKYFIPPFNEHDALTDYYCSKYDLEILDSKGEHLELYLDREPPNIDTNWRCHSWRFYSVYIDGYAKLDVLLGKIKTYIKK